MLEVVQGLEVADLEQDQELINKTMQQIRKKKLKKLNRYPMFIVSWIK